MGNIIPGEKPQDAQRITVEEGRMTGRQEDAAIITYLLRRQKKHSEEQVREGHMTKKDSNEFTDQGWRREKEKRDHTIMRRNTWGIERKGWGNGDGETDEEDEETEDIEREDKKGNEMGYELKKTDQETETIEMSLTSVNDLLDSSDPQIKEIITLSDGSKSTKIEREAG